ncbi:geranylgeranylglyceryl/heptaprenylglyceryl phosphate synthase [Winogradskyella sp. PG-2]|uniref:geranylgeranylglyceryl/heptaprenylglyceryl phosphate synthase n=1 Tax=Winogradskyella sp. PG-2 TaxID=754409 RepID=UPI0004589934|nr:geranylgeranylglyceryl/heptaprenylglyceryl phosphate synthase [Winogradskyella sp. PG-2]BAO75865.1 (S)-3-O-geranylgeranylglyceryl phosphate synthase [Winogradskyella sp. PG-2]
MKGIYQNIITSISNSEKLLAVLIDPDKMKPKVVSSFISKVNQSLATHIFVGGSEVEEGFTDALVTEIKKHTGLPIILFPGDVTQITDKADAILFLSLISGRNPDYLIGKHVEAVSKLSKMNLEVLPTGYLLIENGKQTSVERVSKTKPIKRNQIQSIINTAKAGELLGMKLIYLEAGSGAKDSIDSHTISMVKQELNVPLIVGGGIRSKVELELAFKAGADLVVIGTAFEEDESFFNEIKK